MTHPLEDLLRHRAWMRAVARSLARCEHDADDLVQETWLATMRWPVPVSASPRAWLATVLRRTATKRRTAGRRRVRREEQAAQPERECSTAELAAAAESHARVVQALVRLPEPYRGTLLLRFYEDLPPRVIAARMDVSVETVRSRVRRGLVRLRAELEREHPLLLAPLLWPARKLTGDWTMFTTKVCAAAAAALVLAATVAFSRGEDAAPRFDGSREGAPPLPVFQDDGCAEPPDAKPEEADGGKTKKKDAEKAGVEIDTGDGSLVIQPGPRWLPDKPTGTATLAGVVVDRNGRPLPGAVLYRLKPGLRRGLHHFGLVTEIGKTDAEGRFRIPKQADGRFLLTADFSRVLTRAAPPWGLDTKPAVAVEVAEGATAEGLRIALPVDVAMIGSVEGRVVDDKGRPVPRRFLRVGLHEAGTDPEGRFRVPSVLEGSYRVRCAPLGYRPHITTVQVECGKTATVLMVLELEESGTGSIAGRIVDRDGQAVAGRVVYLNDETEKTSLRMTLSGADGRYVFDRLPDRIVGHALEVQAGYARASKWFGKRRKGVKVGDRGIDLALERVTWIRLEVVSSQTGKPFTQTRGVVHRAEQGAWVSAFTFHLRETAEGVRFRALGGARFRATVEAPGHQERTVEVDVPESDEDHVIRIELEPTG